MSRTLSWNQTNALSRRISQVLRRIERTFPADGALAAELLLLRQFLCSVEVDPLHGSASRLSRLNQESLLRLLIASTSTLGVRRRAIPWQSGDRDRGCQAQGSNGADPRQ